MSVNPYREATWLDAYMDRAKLRSRVKSLEKIALRIDFESSNGLTVRRDIEFLEGIVQRISELRARKTIQRGDMIPTRRERRRLERAEWNRISQ